MTQSQWTAGLTAIAADEPTPAVQRNMFQYLATLHQEVVDFGFNVALGSHAIILSYLEEGRVTWDDLPLIQALKERYSYRSPNPIMGSLVKLDWRIASGGSAGIIILGLVLGSLPMLTMALIMTITVAFAA